jgi:predicted phosphohydrolase
VAFDQYRDAERDWLREAIKSPEFINAPFKVTIVHMPPFGGWHGEDEVWSKFVPLLNEAKIDVMLCGHMHKHMNQQSGNGINFPVLVNSNNAVVRAKATSTLLDLKVISEKGEQVDQIQLKK